MLALTGVCPAETIFPGPDGKLYTAGADSKLYRSFPGSSEVEVVAYLGGRPLAGAFDAQGNIIFCDAARVCCTFHMQFQL